MRLAGSVVVTGASQGIGLGVVVELARRGAHVIAGVVDEAARAEVESRIGGIVEVRIVDVTQLDEFNMPSDLGVLVNNAGIRPPNLPIEHQDISEWRRTFAVNVFGPIALCQRAIAVMRARGGGVICNIGSTSIFEPTPFLGPYRASKAAMAAFNETLQVEVAQFNIRVIEMTPRATETPMNRGSFTRQLVQGARYPGYGDLAHRLNAWAQSNLTPPTSVEIAAARIVDALESDSRELRRGTDDVSQARLERWRRSSDEEVLAEVAKKLDQVIDPDPISQGDHNNGG